MPAGLAATSALQVSKYRGIIAREFGERRAANINSVSDYPKMRDLEVGAAREKLNFFTVAIAVGRDCISGTRWALVRGHEEEPIDSIQISK